MSTREHWESVYRRKSPGDVSWYRPHLDRSLEFIGAARLARGAAIVDVGGGTSTLVDDLLELDFTDVAVLDISEAAVTAAKQRLGERAERAAWIVGDVTQVELPEHRWDFWHDRAVFHFLMDEIARHRYIAAVGRALKPGGHIVVATFGPEGPTRCSGLEVMRYSPDSLHGEFGPSFEKIGSAVETHVTPWGSEQEFIYCFCRMPR
ncbi:MAG: class I SAM-dependent methyltransferase [Candidatus Eiseniibacteriota bacterium]